MRIVSLIMGLPTYFFLWTEGLKVPMTNLTCTQIIKKPSFQNIIKRPSK